MNMIFEIIKKLNLSILVAIALLITGNALAQNTTDWPNFHGPNRDNKSTETGLLKQWPEGGPKLLWTASGLGVGYSSVSIADGMIFTAGTSDEQGSVQALDMDGNQIWKSPNGGAWSTEWRWARSYLGARATPAYSDGRVYQLGETGRLASFDAKTGKEIWAIDLPKEFDAEAPGYGFSESVLIDGDRLYCSPAGKKGFLVCLNKQDGSLIWANTEIPGETNYCSPVMTEHNGRKQIFSFSSTRAYGADEATGKLLWSVERLDTHGLKNTDPIYHDGHVFITAGYGLGSMVIKLNDSGGKIVPEVVWESDLMDNQHGGVIFHDGYLYGAGHEARGWFCLDFMTGKEMWKARGKGAITYADGMLYCLEENGDINLVPATSQGYQSVGSFEVPDGGKGPHWAHPVVHNGRLYVRHADQLFVYDVKHE